MAVADLEDPGGLAQTQLNRTNFLDRLQIESKLNTTSLRLLHFLLLFATFVAAIATYDPVKAIADVHHSLGQRYRIAALSSIEDVDGIIDYMDFFITTTYTMASALVDVNTMDRIDPVRCFSDGVSDICKLAYWQFPGYNASAPNFVNATEALAGIGRIGLEQARPLVLESRKDYPHGLVVPLSPVVWQTRASRVPCTGFGHIYNEQVLAAGNCAPNTDCDQPTSSFDFSLQDAEGGSLYITYEEAAFICVDHSKPAEEFRDKSWLADAKWADLHDGALLEPVELNDELVWFKFVSDAAYLQAPTNNVVNGTRVAWNDPMWDDERGLEGSTRRLWNQQYLRSNKSERTNTFVTRETKSVKIAALVLVATGAGQPDLFTLIVVTFDVSPVGLVTGSVLLSSIAGTEGGWYGLVAVAILLSLLRIAEVLGLLRLCHRGRPKPRGHESFRTRLNNPKQLMDLLLPTAATAYLAGQLVVDVSPPHIADALTKAFFTNAQDEYFEAYRNILAMARVQQNFKVSGFIICMAFLVRALLMLEIHPRFQVLLDALGHSSSDILHVVLAVLPMLLLLAFLAFWMFGTQAEGGGPFGSFGNAFRNLLPFVVPGIPAGFTSSSGEVLFMLWASLCIFFMRIFYLVIIASIVKAFMTAKGAVDHRESENNFPQDAADAVVSAFRRWRRGWPSPSELLARLQPDLEEMHALAEAGKPNAFTAAELRRLCPGMGLEDAEAMCAFYSRKVREGGGWPLLEQVECFRWTAEEMRAMAGGALLASPGADGEKDPGTSFSQTLRCLGDARDGTDGVQDPAAPLATADQVAEIARRQERLEVSLDRVVEQLSRLSENMSRGVSLQSAPAKRVPDCASTFCRVDVTPASAAPFEAGV